MTLCWVGALNLTKNLTWRVWVIWQTSDKWGGGKTSKFNMTILERSLRAFQTGKPYFLLLRSAIGPMECPLTGTNRWSNGFIIIRKHWKSPCFSTTSLRTNRSAYFECTWQQHFVFFIFQLKELANQEIWFKERSLFENDSYSGKGTFSERLSIKRHSHFWVVVSWICWGTTTVGEFNATPQYDTKHAIFSWISRVSSQNTPPLSQNTPLVSQHPAEGRKFFEVFGDI